MRPIALLLMRWNVGPHCSWLQHTDTGLRVQIEPADSAVPCARPRVSFSTADGVEMVASLDGGEVGQRRFEAEWRSLRLPLDEDAEAASRRLLEEAVAVALYRASAVRS